MASAHDFHLVKISSTVRCLVENDCFHEQPHLYVVIGESHSVLIDTGCGTGNLAAFIRKELGDKVADNLIVVNTHNHYDHVSGNHRFVGRPICMGDKDKEYSNDLFNSMGSIVGCDVKQYTVTRWLSHLEKISLSDTDAENYLQVLHTPGHTPDSICLWYPKEKRIFVGDFIYRYAPVLCITIKSSPLKFEQAAHMLVKFIDEQEKDGSSVRLSCGHIDSQLESDWLRQFAQLLNRVNAGKAKETGEGGKKKSKKYAYYSTDDGNVTFQVGSVLNDPKLLTD